MPHPHHIIYHTVPTSHYISPYTKHHHLPHTTVHYTTHHTTQFHTSHIAPQDSTHTHCHTICHLPTQTTHTAHQPTSHHTTPHHGAASSPETSRFLRGSTFPSLECASGSQSVSSKPQESGRKCSARRGGISGFCCHGNHWHRLASGCREGKLGTGFGP